jgi:YVTN family beta-propeller protein
MKKIVLVFTVGLMAYTLKAEVTIIDTIFLGGMVTGIGVDPTTNKIYVANIKYNEVSVIDATTHSLITTIPVGEHPCGIGVNLANNKVYVANSNYKENSVIVIDGTKDSVIGKINNIFINSYFPWDIKVNSIYNMIYVVGFFSLIMPPTRLAIINGTNDSIITRISMEGEGIGIGETSNTVYVGDKTGRLLVIDGFSSSVKDTIPRCSRSIKEPFSMEVIEFSTPTIYLSLGYECRSDSSVIVINGDTVKAVIPINTPIWALGVNSNLNRIYVASAPFFTADTARVSIIDGTTDSVVQTIPIPSGAYWIGVDESRNRFYVSCYLDGMVLVFQDDIETEETKTNLKMQD